jgi:hypothetical protein
MTRSIVIIGGNLRSLSSAHTILDYDPDTDLHIMEEAAEIGLIGEGPGILPHWPVTPAHWLCELGSQEPNLSSSAIRRSWLEKAMATSLANRGCIFHLRTRVEAVNDGGKVTFVGAGLLGSGELRFDTVLDMREPINSNTEWEGGICLQDHAPSFGDQGSRPDGTIEVWWRDNNPDQGKWVHRMRWGGSDPASSVETDINAGIETASTLIDTIIQP